MSTHTTEPIAPTAQAIDAVLARNPSGPWSIHDEHWGVDIRTKSGRWRYVTSRVMHNGEPHYWTIRGEGSSNGCRETCIPASRVVAAQAHHFAGTVAS